MRTDILYWLALAAAIASMSALGYFLGRASLRRQLQLALHPHSLPKLRSTRSAWWASWLQGVSTAMLGAIVTTILVTVIVGSAQHRQVLSAELDRLVLQLGSPEHAFATEAARLLRQSGWLTDGSLRGANLPGANLHGAHLETAHLQGANLAAADLTLAWLNGANLRSADLTRAYLPYAQIRHADLQGAILYYANLEGADLDGTNLRDSRLQFAVLYGASLRGADLTGATINATGFARSDLTGAVLSLEQLLGTSSLRGATMPDGLVYDGRYNIPSELAEASSRGLNTADPQAMADWYAVPLSKYIDGQRWAHEHLP